MDLEKIANKVVDTDLLVIGGGTGGCPLAGKAAERGLRVTIVEKSKTDRSGNVGHGVDSYGVFPHGISVTELIRMWMDRMSHSMQGKGRWVNLNLDYVLFDKGFWALEELERMGIPMKWDDGQYYWTPHMIHQDGLKLGLRVHWHNVKPIMAKMCRDRGVNILDRVMVVDLLTNEGRVVGATAVNTRTGEFIVIKAKAIAMASGMFCRLFEPETPSPWRYKMRYHYCPATTSGDGWAAAYRAGAGVAHMDDASWAVRIRDDMTCSFGNFVNNDGIFGRVYNWKGESVSHDEQSYRGYAQAEMKGNTPFYQSLEHMPDDFQKRLELNYLDEWFFALKMAQDRGFNPRTHRWEFMSNKLLQFMMVQGIWVTEDFKSPYLQGLYAIGDCAAGVGGAHGACISGLVVGDTVDRYISEAGEPVIDEAQVESQKQIALAPLSAKDGTEPMELECAIRNICERYAGVFKSEGTLQEGLRRFNSLKREFLPELMAKNPHYLMRCLEVRNIMDLAELYLKGSLDRKESRKGFIRTDYPEVDESRTNMCRVDRMENGKHLHEFIEVPELKPEYLKEKQKCM